MILQRLAVTCLLVAACKSDAPNWAAKCVPNNVPDGVICTITNEGKKAGRACITVRLGVPNRPMPLMARRVCTRTIEPKSSVTLTPPLLEDVEPCLNEGRWLCPIDILETSQQMGENVPGGS